MSVSDREAAARSARAQQIGLFRYALVRPATDPELTTRQRGALVRSLAEQTHAGPGGEPVRVSRKTIDRWIRAWRSGGFDALVPAPRQVAPRTDATVLELAVGLKKENPHRTATQVARILRAQLDWSPSERTLQRLFARHQLNRRPDRPAPGAFGRFEADHINEIWTADVMHGPKINGHRTYLFAVIDDHSRLIVGAKFCYREDTIRLAGVLHTALQSRGVPGHLYVDNGSPFVDSWLLRACAKLGVQLTHSQPGRPEGRGKIERWFATVRQQFLVELTTGDEQNKPGQKTKTAAPGVQRLVGDIDELNRLLTVWCETVYHRRVHTETGRSPLERYHHSEPPVLPGAGLLREAFLWGEYRLVRKTATVELYGNTYRVDPFLVGRRVELVFDPFDLTEVAVHWQNKPVGAATPHVIGRHAHPKAQPELPETDQPGPTGIDYLGLLETEHTTNVTDRLRLSDLDHHDRQPGTEPATRPEPDDAATNAQPTALDDAPDQPGQSKP